jgi:Tol biopolymer transport system component/tRNA A-37 threonylcarbamoyl transferase component Bud32
MPLSAGTRLGPYEILGLLGAGGMGVVYKARDTRLDRTVAIKTLPVDKLADEGRKARFVQEAKAASALNHPNIVSIYDIASDDGIDFLVMEFVAGKTLDQLIPKKGLKVDEVLRLAVQAADALATAHAAGIVHRDLKPGNLMVNDAGQVKVLDFGLAKLAERPAAPNDTTVPLVMQAEPQTAEGTVVGTAAYMSPEQIEGKPLDGRSDIFSFGIVLYEMITGQRAFRGETKMATLSAILKQEPMPAGEIVEGLPPEVDRIVTRCLRKDAARRFQHMEDLKVALQELKEESDSGRLAPVPARKVGRRSAIVGLAAIAMLLMGLAALGWLYLRPSPVTTRRLTLLVSTANPAVDPTLSPDGKMIAYVSDEQGQTDLFVSRVAGGGRIRLTNDQEKESVPRFSPDGEHILFARVGASAPEIWMVPTLGGESTQVVANAFDPAWSPDGARIAFVSRPPGQADALVTAAVNGSEPRVVMRSDGALPFFSSPAWSPDGTRLVVARSTGGIAGELWLVPLDGGAARRVHQDNAGVFSSEPVFTPDGRGLIHRSNRGGATNLWILFLDGNRLERLTTGPGPDASPSVARDGSIAFANERSRSTLILQDLASGQTREVLAHSSIIWGPAFSPDGNEIAFSRAETDGSWHIWIAAAQGGAARRLTSGPLPEIYPRFTADGSAVVYNTWSSGPDRVWRVPRAGGPAVALTPMRDRSDQYADISPDGRRLAFARTEKEQTRLYVASLNGGEARRLTDSPSTLPRWSPDGRWIAFSPHRGYSGGIFVIGADGNGMRQLSETGSWPVWWPDGKRISYQNTGPDGSEQILTVPFAGGAPKPLASIRFRGTNYTFDISRDGKFLVTSNSLDLSSDIWLLSPGR